MTADAAEILYRIAWAFYAFGPQLLICMALAYYAAKRSGGNLLNWLATGFLAAVVPVAGVIAMGLLFHRASRLARSKAP